MITDATEGNTEGSTTDTTTENILVGGHLLGSCEVRLVSLDNNMTQQLFLREGFT